MRDVQANGQRRDQHRHMGSLYLTMWHVWWNVTDIIIVTPDMVSQISPSQAQNISCNIHYLKVWIHCMHFADLISYQCTKVWFQSLDVSCHKRIVFLLSVVHKETWWQIMICARPIWSEVWTLSDLRYICYRLVCLKKCHLSEDTFGDAVVNVPVKWYIIGGYIGHL